MADEFVTVGRFYTANEAEMARAALEAEGIAAFVTDANMASMLSNAVGGAKVEVSPADADRAKQFLAAWSPPRASGESEADTVGTSTCLQCGRPMPEWLATCPECGWTYEVQGSVEP